MLVVSCLKCSLVMLTGIYFTSLSSSRNGSHAFNFSGLFPSFLVSVPYLLRDLNTEIVQILSSSSLRSHIYFLSIIRTRWNLNYFLYDFIFRYNMFSGFLLLTASLLTRTFKLAFQTNCLGQVPQKKFCHHSDIQNSDSIAWLSS